ncbi:GNAT family N-acetyltransferase [Alteromonas lipolytica]|uniref:N-acetyltransferase domain-containing protein n=1 Tax=Alteromonas lipolytica TaxID=1856405 RepID=A0A1E8FIK3_9ALTE|nr:GNAT family N-acetyltransferase [Alteromonas lipolytica]OFI35749.1 hypothetical protein BFC17_10710 [Alteromonas lipolytica]GGF80462.1 acetyltransferase [Alteromonas lipolytica]
MINPTELKLVKPAMTWQASYQRYIEELGDEERYPFPMDFDHRDFAAMLQKIADFAAGVNLPAGYVPSTTLWLVCGAKLLAVANIRHYLNDDLRFAGGHIGLGVRPSARGHSLGSYLLGEAVKYARQLGIGDVHVHCYHNNLASAGMIKRCGGQLESEVALDDSAKGQIVHRYIIGE